MNKPALAVNNLDGMFKSMQNAQPTEVSIDLIDIKPQARKRFETEEHPLEGLAETIKKIGLLSPVTLRTRPAGRYELVAGERRLRAAKLAGLTKIKCTIQTFTDKQSRTAQFIENEHRLELDPYEKAVALKEMLDEDHGGDRTSLLTALGRPNGAAWLAQHLALIDLPPQAARLLHDGLSKDVSTINQVKLVEKHNPEKAKALVDQAAARPGEVDLRKQAKEAVKQVKPASTAAKKPTSGGSQPSTATPRDRSQEEPGTAFVSSGAGVFPAPPMKPHERAITTLIDAARKPGADAVKLAQAVPTTDRELITKHGQELFQRGKKTVDLVPALISGLARNEFGKTPVELFNLTAFLLGQGEADTFTVDAVIAAIANATK